MPIGTPHGTLDYKQVSKVTFVGASSNTVIDTTTGSLGVGVDGNGPTSNLHVVGNAFVSSNLTVSGFVGTSEIGALTIPSGTTAQQPTGVAGMIRFNTTVNRLELYNGSVWQSLGGIVASGGTVTIVGGYKTHTFTTSGTFEVTSGGDIEYLIVAGGGAGATTDGGGGGAGGVVTGTTNIQPGSYTIVIGTGGSFVDIDDRAGLSGNDSTALGFTAMGGGGGGNDRELTSGVSGQGPKTGGSGGGGGSRQDGTKFAGAAGIQNSTYGYGFGNNGGDGVNSPSTRAGGGGGAGEAGKNGNDGSRPAGGGNGIQWPSGSVLYYGGGGGGGHNVNGTGGQGGGGQGSTNTSSPSVAGTPNTGGGGGGGGGSHSRGSSGGSGIVIIRYLT